MNCFLTANGLVAATDTDSNQGDRTRLLNGEILLQTRPYTAWGGAVTAQLYLPTERSHIWEQITNYPRWVDYFPDLTRSELISDPNASSTGGKRLYQVATKKFLMLTAQVEIVLRVFELRSRQAMHQIQFCLEKGNFNDFSADLKLQDYAGGTLLTYAVQATPTIPVPSMLVQEAIRLDLPANMHRMRQVLCNGA